MYHGAIIRAKTSLAQDKSTNAQAGKNSANSATEPTPDKLLEQAKIDAENIRQKALLEAKQERDVILQQAKIDSEAKIAGHILQLSQDFRKTVRQQETKIGKVVANTIRQIISDIPSQELQRDVLKTALRQFADESALKVRVPPASFDQTWWANWKWAMDNNFDVNTITKDPSLNEGRCILEFANHKVDIGIQTQLDSLVQIATGRSAKSTEQPQVPSPDVISSKATSIEIPATSATDQPEQTQEVI